MYLCFQFIFISQILIVDLSFYLFHLLRLLSHFLHNSMNSSKLTAVLYLPLDLKMLLQNFVRLLSVAAYISQPCALFLSLVNYRYFLLIMSFIRLGVLCHYCFYFIPSSLLLFFLHTWNISPIHFTLS
jgi:hypothetical protein